MTNIVSTSSLDSLHSFSKDNRNDQGVNGQHNPPSHINNGDVEKNYDGGLLNPETSRRTFEDDEYDENNNAEAIISRELTKQDDFDIPDGGYGWVIVGVFFFGNFCCWGGNSGFSVYLAEYIQHNTYGGTGVDYAAVGGLAFGAGLIFAPIITYFVGLTSANTSLFVGAACQLAACLLASFATKLWHLYLTQGMLMGFGLALVAAPIPTIVPQWFKKKRSLAMGIGAGGSGAGGILFNLAMQKVTEVKSVRWALRVQTIICVSIIVVCGFLLRTRGDKINPEFHPFDKQVLKLVPFWLICSWLAFTMFGYVTTQYCLSDATISLGFSAKQGSLSAALMNVGVLIGRPMCGQFADVFGPITIGVIVYALCGIFCLTLWLAGRNLGTIWSFSILIGGLMGFVWGAMGAIIPRIVGLRKVGVTFGMCWVVVAASGIVSPIIGLALKKQKPEGVSVMPSQYVWAALFAGLSFFVASSSLLVLRGYVIARDNLAENITADSDVGQELPVKVSPKKVLESVLVVKHHKKV